MKILLYFFCLILFAVRLEAQSGQKITQIKKAVAGNAGTKPASPGTSLLHGMFSAPTGTSVMIQNNAKNDFSPTVPKESGKTFSTNTFNFPNALADGSTFKIAIKKTPAGQTCTVYSGGEGTMPADANKLRIGCDFTYDLISRSTNDGTFSSFYESSDGVVGGNSGEEGRYVAFISSAAGFVGSTGKYRQVFWRDRNTGITKLISASVVGGEVGNGDCYAPALSGEGKSVAFESNATNLVEEDKNGVRDVFLWQAATNTIKKVSKATGGKEANAESYEPSVSGDGSLVAFTSTASNISSTEKGVSNNNVFLYDVANDNSIMISVDPLSRKGGGGSKPSISHDGNRIAFYSHTATLVAGDNNGLWDIFLWEKNIPALKRVSLTANGKERNQGTESVNRIVAPAISGNGRYIAFSTTATNMVPGDTNTWQDVFVYDINTGNTVIASQGADGKPGNADSPVEQGEKIAISFDGKWVAFSTNASNIGVPAANIVLHDMATGLNRAVSSVVGSSVGRPTMSYTGAYIVFGIGGKLDSRYPSSGIFANYTGIGPCRSCPD